MPSSGTETVRGEHASLHRAHGVQADKKGHGKDAQEGSRQGCIRTVTARMLKKGYGKDA